MTCSSLFFFFFLLIGALIACTGTLHQQSYTGIHPVLQHLNSGAGEGCREWETEGERKWEVFISPRVFLRFCFNFLCYSGTCVSGYVIGCGSLCSQAILHRWTHSKMRYWEIKYRNRNQNQCNVRKVSWLWFKAAQDIPRLTDSSSFFNLCWWGGTVCACVCARAHVCMCVCGGVHRERKNTIK